MYHNDRNDIVELADDVLSCTYLTTSRLKDGTTILHLALALDPHKEYADPAQLKLHLTNGVNHALLQPLSTDPAWDETAEKQEEGAVEPPEKERVPLSEQGPQLAALAAGPASPVSDQPDLAPQTQLTVEQQAETATDQPVDAMPDQSEVVGLPRPAASPVEEQATPIEPAAEESAPTAEEEAAQDASDVDEEEKLQQELAAIEARRKLNAERVARWRQGKLGEQTTIGGQPNQESAGGAPSA